SFSLPLGRAALVCGSFASPSPASGTGDLASVVFLKVDRAAATRAASRTHVWSPPSWTPTVPRDIPVSKKAEVARLTALLESLDALERTRAYKLAIFNDHDLYEALPIRIAPALGVL